jgi:hypothetical protein
LGVNPPGGLPTSPSPHSARTTAISSMTMGHRADWLCNRSGRSPAPGQICPLCAETRATLRGSLQALAVDHEVFRSDAGVSCGKPHDQQFWCALVCPGEESAVARRSLMLALLGYVRSTARQSMLQRRAEPDRPGWTGPSRRAVQLPFADHDLVAQGADLGVLSHRQRSDVLPTRRPGGRRYRHPHGVGLLAENSSNRPHSLGPNESSKTD